jgi:diacylglycerol kinase
VKNASLPARLGYARDGIRLIWRREKTFRTHCLFALAALGAAALLGIGPVWWAIIILCIALVFALEAMNSAFEYAIDRLHPELHEEIGHAKDAAAGAVLLASMGAAIVGTLMLLDWSLRS